MSQELERIAISTYKKNLKYFQKYQPNIYSKLAAYDSAIEQGLHQSKYDLILKENYFDVLEYATQNYLYNANSNDYATHAKDSINYEKNHNVFETFKNIVIKEDDLVKYSNLSIVENNLSGLAPILFYCQKNMPKTFQMIAIKKFIFFGVGLGLHITSIHKKINADIYLIVEDDLELFKLSLFTTAYYEIAKKSTLIFSVFDSDKEFSAPAMKFLTTQFKDNQYLKYFQMLNQSENKLKEFQIKIASQSHNLFYYSAILEQYLRPLQYINDNYHFLNILKPIFDEKPILFLAAGPSLQKNINFVKKNQNKFIIVALSAVLNILQKEEIFPDIVTHIDGLEDSIVHFSKLESLDFCKDTSFVISSRSPKEIVNLLNKDNIFFFENGTNYKKDLGNLSATCVGSTTYLLLLALGIKDMYLLGLDLALDRKTGATHASGHEYSQNLDLGANILNNDTITFKDTVLKVDGNLHATVFTTPDFINSINSINDTSQYFKKDNQSIFNLSDGAYFTNTQAVQISTIELKTLPLLSKQNIKNNLHRILTNNSTQKMTDTEYDEVKQRYKHSCEIENVLKKQHETLYQDKKSFLSSLDILFQNLCSSSSLAAHDLSLIYQEYFQLLYPFVFDFFNTYGFKENPIILKELNYLLLTQLQRILKVYKDELYKVIKG